MSAEYVLPEQRERQRVVFGGISATHVLVESTFPAASHPGMFTRRAWDRRALCGSLSACVVGGDASDWPTEREPLDISDVSCRRCRARYERWAAPQSARPDATP